MESFYKSIFFKYWLPFIIWAMIMITISSLPSSSLPTLGIEFGDKIVHLFEYLIFCLLFIRALKNSLIEINYLMIIYPIGILFALIDELHQYFIPGRYVQMNDLLANWLGILIGPIVFKILNKGKI